LYGGKNIAQAFLENNKSMIDTIEEEIEKR
jgi:hypothetical protein